MSEPLSSDTIDFLWGQAVTLDPKLSGFRGDADAGAVICARHGHAAVISQCFGYQYCDRCGAQVGDSLAGASVGGDKVLVAHDCPTCRMAWDSADFWGRFGVRPEGGGFLQETSAETAASAQATAKRMREDPTGVLEEIKREHAADKARRARDGAEFVATRSEAEWRAYIAQDPAGFAQMVEGLDGARMSALAELLRV